MPGHKSLRVILIPLFLFSIPSASCYEEEFQTLYLFALHCWFTFGGSGRHLMWCECEIANIRVLLHTPAWFESSSGAGHSFLYRPMTLETTAAEKNETSLHFFVSFLLLLAFISVKKKNAPLSSAAYEKLKFPSQHMVHVFIFLLAYV